MVDQQFKKMFRNKFFKSYLHWLGIFSAKQLESFVIDSVNANFNRAIINKLCLDALKMNHEILINSPNLDSKFAATRGIASIGRLGFDITELLEKEKVNQEGTEKIGYLIPEAQFLPFGK
jgi:hypothetical protein